MIAIASLTTGIENIWMIVALILFTHSVALHTIPLSKGIKPRSETLRNAPRRAVLRPPQKLPQGVSHVTAIMRRRSKIAYSLEGVADMKLFIWTDFCPDYTSGLAFAIAKDETEARALIEKERGFAVYEWGTLEVRPLTRKVARCVSGGA
jgi:hypothetical protein